MIHKYSDTGFTLLEIMLAMFMLATVVTMVLLSISGSLRVVEATGKQGDVYYRAQVALQRMSEDISSALLVDGIEFYGNSSDNDGERGNILEFTSTGHVVFDPENDHPGIALISYILKPDKEHDESYVILRSDNLLRPSDTAETYRGDDVEAFLLCDRLRRVQFVYLDEAGNELDEWTSVPDDINADDERKLPVTVRITLEFWLDEQLENSIVFSTAVLLPVGLINVQVPGSGKNA